jgi:hypothetical protein
MLSSTVQDRVHNREVLIAVIEQQTTTVWEPKTSYGLLGICELSYFVLTLRFHGLCMQYKIADQASYPSSISLPSPPYSSNAIFLMRHNKNCNSASHSELTSLYSF